VISLHASKTQKLIVDANIGEKQEGHSKTLQKEYVMLSQASLILLSISESKNYLPIFEIWQ